MRKSRKRILVVSSLTLLGLACPLSAIALVPNEAISVSAGSSIRYALSSQTVVDSRINSGDLRTSGDVSGEGSYLVLGEGKVIARTRINNYVDAGLSYVYKASFDVKLKEFGQGGKFRICSGLPSASSSYDGDGSLIIEIENKYGFYFLSVTEYLGEGITNPLYKQAEMPSLKESKVLSFAISFCTDGSYTLSINGATILDEAKALGNGAGYFGFESIGDNKILISSMSVYGFIYSSPENVPSYKETFDAETGEKGHYNANYFYSASSSGPISPSYLAVDENTGALHFSHVGDSHITTRYAYSNFSLEFDIPQIQKEAGTDSDGNIVSPIISNFGISWGETNVSDSPSNTWMYHNLLLFQNTGVNDSSADHTKVNERPTLNLYSATSGLKSITLTGENNFFSPSETRAPTLKFTMIDGALDVYLRYSDEADYGTPFFHYDFGQTAEGYVRILTLGDSSMPSTGVKGLTSNDFSIDNLTLENLDSASYRQETKVTYKANGITGGTDFNYTTSPDEGDLIGNKLGGSASKESHVEANGLAKFLLDLSSFFLSIFKRS